MRTWGAWASVVGLGFTVACSDGLRNAAGSGGVANSAGEANSAGTEAFDCDSRVRGKCFDCKTGVGVDRNCENGEWTCPAGTVPAAECPLAPCPQWTDGCCAPGAATATAFLCDVSGAQQTVCPARSFWGAKPGDACPTPDPCDVDAAADLTSKDCSLLGGTCYFRESLESYSCYCMQTDGDKPTWQCFASSNFR